MAGAAHVSRAPMSTSPRVHSELSRIDAFVPLLPALGNRWAAARPWEGRTVALCMHLTTITLALVRELVLGGGRWVVGAANPATTDPGVVDALRDLGVEVHSGRGRESGVEPLVDADPELFGDVGFHLGRSLLAHHHHPRAGVEITRSGISRLRELVLPFPVVNINDGRLKPAIESRRGVGEGLWPAFTAQTGRHLGGQRVVVLGYGPVGSGVAAWARAFGASVEVVEIDPVQRLIASFDGFPTPDLAAALPDAQVVVTATGRRQSLPTAMLGGLRDGAILVSAGHLPDELDVVGLRMLATHVDQISAHVVRYRLADGRTISVLADGNPLNIVLNSGSPEPVLLQFAVLGLSLEWLAGYTPPPGEVALPVHIEEDAARAMLAVRS